MSKINFLLAQMASTTILFGLITLILFFLNQSINKIEAQIANLQETIEQIQSDVKAQETSLILLEERVLYLEELEGVEFVDLPINPLPALKGAK